MSTVSVRYKLYEQDGKGYPPYFTDPAVTFDPGIIVYDSWYYGNLTADDPAYWIATKEQYLMEASGLPLPPLKEAKIKAIDARTVVLVAGGFPYDSCYFSMSEDAQRNWVAMGTAQSLGMLSFPLQVAKVDESPYELTDSAALMSFLGAYMTYQTGANYPIAKGRLLKAQVTAATTIEELNAIIDDR